MRNFKIKINFKILAHALTGTFSIGHLSSGQLYSSALYLNMFSGKIPKLFVRKLKHKKKARHPTSIFEDSPLMY